jgi:hypothetical protein
VTKPAQINRFLAYYEGFHAAELVIRLWMPRSPSTSRDQAIFVDQATDASLSSDAVLLKIDRFR